MTRILFAVLAVMSLVLFAGTLVSWWISYVRGIHFTHVDRGASAAYEIFSAKAFSFSKSLMMNFSSPPAELKFLTH